MSAALPMSPTDPIEGACAVVAICPAVQGAGSALGQAAGSAARTASTDAAIGVLHAIGSAINDAARHAVDQMLGMAFGTVNGVDLTSTWFGLRLQAMVAVTALVVFPLLAAATIGALIRQDSGRLVRAWLVWLPVAGFLTACIVPLVSGAMTASDQMTKVMTDRSGVDLQNAFGTLLPAVTTTGGLLGVVVAVLVLLAGLVLWLELLVRDAAIYVTVFFLPLILAGLLWPAAAHMVKRALEVLVALILSKFVIVAVLTLGVAAIGSRNDPSRDILAGVAILLLAAFAPMTLLRLVPVIEAAAIGHLEGRARQPIRAAADTAGRLHRQMPLAARMLGADLSGSPGDGGAEPGGRATAAARRVVASVLATEPSGTVGSAGEGGPTGGARPSGGGVGGDGGGAGGSGANGAGANGAGESGGGAASGLTDHTGDVGAGGAPRSGSSDQWAPGGIPFFDGQPDEDDQSGAGAPSVSHHHSGQPSWVGSSADGEGGGQAPGGEREPAS